MWGKANLSFSIDELHVPFFHHLLYSLVTASEFFNVLILPILSPFLLGKETWSDMIVLSKQYKVENNLRVNSLSTNQALKLKKKKKHAGSIIFKASLQTENCSVMPDGTYTQHMRYFLIQVSETR